MPLVDPDKPENTLANVRAYVEDFIGAGKTDIDLDSLIDSIVKRIHRRWHPRWAKIYVDTTVPITTGTVELPADFLKLSRITDQSDEPTTFYEPGVDYDLQEYNTSTTDPRRKLQWIEVPTVAVDVRVWYWRRPVRATDPDDLVDIDPSYIDVILYGVKMMLAAKDTSIDSFNIWKGEYENELQRMIDDDTDNDNSNKSIPLNSDGSQVAYDTGEII